MTNYQLLIGDCIESMRSMANQSVNCCVTSPPYFGLRDYGVDGQIGLEETPEAYIAKMVEVFREVKRVLRDDGTLWVNIGDSYASGGRKTRDSDAKLEQRGMSTRPKDAFGIKQKDLIGIPWMLAFALRADGWYLRQDIIWHKPNPMPESVTDRCTKAHEYVFLLSKSPKYHYDIDATRIPHEGTNPDIPWRERQYGGTDGVGELNGEGSYKRGTSRQPCGNHPLGKNRRSVWTVAPRPFKGAHFATFPPKLIEPCILAGCPVGGTVLDPFGGSGTTAGVALLHGRNAVLCELSKEYADLVHARVASIMGIRSSQLDMLEAGE
jgi:site-specific DNA-methyltransferase (adenine-specific)